jgi:hypothetical protein
MTGPGPNRAVLLGLCLLGVAMLDPSRASAQTSCPGPDGRWARLKVAPGLPSTVDRNKLTLLLNSQLGPSKLGLCSEEPLPATPPAAVLQVSPGGAGFVAIEVSTPDQKQPTGVGTVDLRRLPADGHTLAVATIASEIVRAKLETVLPITPPKAPSESAPAPAGELSLAATAPADRLSRWELAAAMGASRFEAGLNQWGPDLQGTVRIWRFLSAQLRLGYRRGGETRAAHGTVSPEAFAGGAGLRETLPSPWARLGLGLYERLDLVRVHFAATSRDGDVTTRSTSLNAAVANAGLQIKLRLGRRASFFVQGGACWTLMGARARDAGVAVVALDGFGGELASGIDLEF